MARTQDKRFWLAGGAVTAAVIAAVGWIGVISPQRSSTNSLRSEADSAQTQNAVLEGKVAKLKQQNDNVGTLTASLQAALAALPFDSGLPAFTRQLSTQAATAGVSLTSISVGGIAATTGTGAVATTPTTSTTIAPTTAAVASVLVAIPITLVSTGTGQAQLAFLKAIQVTGPRRALVLSTALGGGSTAGGGSIDGGSTMTTQLSIFSAPLSAAAKAQLEKLLAGS